MECTWLPSAPVAVAVAAGAILLLGWRSIRRRTHDTPDMRRCREDFRRDLVYVWSFPRPQRALPDLSPFALKVETYLRIASIPYQSRHIKFNERSQKGQIPFVYLNGREVSDSTVILSALEDHFQPGLEAGLSGEARGSARAFGRMLDQATVWTYFYYRYVVANLKLWHAVQLPYNKFLTYVIAKLTARGMRSRSVEQGTGRLSEQEMWRVAYDDLQAISDYLADKDYFLGDRATTVDAILFGHLAQIVYIDVPYPHRTYIQERCPNILRYVRRVKEEYWPDWDQLISTPGLECKYTPPPPAAAADDDNDEH